MFDNVGRKIKGLAKISCWIGIICSFIIGIAIVVIMKGIDDEVGNVSSVVSLGVLIAIVVIVIGSFWSWLVSLGIYGFGELVENSRIIVEDTLNISRLSKRILKTMQVKNTRREQKIPADYQNDEMNNDGTSEKYEEKSDNVTDSLLDDSQYLSCDEVDNFGMFMEMLRKNPLVIFACIIFIVCLVALLISVP